MDDKDTIVLTGSESSGSNDTYVINLNDTYGATTSYPTGIVAQDISSLSGSYSITLNDTIDLSSITITGNGGASGAVGSVTIGGAGSGFSAEPQWWVASPNTHIEISEVEKMCSEYPALAKVYENFKTIYDLVKQDWEGKKNADKNS